MHLINASKCIFNLIYRQCLTNFINNAETDTLDEFLNAKNFARHIYFFLTTKELI